MELEFKISIEDDVEDAREVEIEDYSGMTFTKAKSILKEEGFSDISILGQTDTSGKDKWVVVDQNKPKGNSVCIMDSIVLDCIPTDEYVAQTFSGKSVSEIIEWAKHNEIELGYKKYRNDKELDISKYADFEKKEWRIIQSSFDTKKGNILLRVSRGYDEAEDIVVEVVEAEDKPQETAVETKETSTQTAEEPQATEQTQQAEQPQTTPEKQTTEVPKQESEKQTTEKPKEEIVIPASFDPEFYATHNPDVVAACGNSPEELYKHYQNYGKKEGRLQNAEEEAAKLAKLQEQPQPEPTPQITEQPQPQPEPQPQPQTPSAGSGDGRVCYITPSGKRWHLDKECAGKNAIQTTVGEAKQNPRITGPCGVCAKYE